MKTQELCALNKTASPAPLKAFNTSVSMNQLQLLYQNMLNNPLE
jgi:hypothetical protein